MHRETLPEGYSFAEKVSAQEVINLRTTCQWGAERRIEAWRQAIDTSLAVVGVRIESDLVGVGFLSGNTRHAFLSDLTVHPEHRSRGIGRAIVARRLNLASSMGPNGIPYIYAEILASNTLSDYYVQLGFAGVEGIIKLV